MVMVWIKMSERHTMYSHYHDSRAEKFDQGVPPAGAGLRTWGPQCSVSTVGPKPSVPSAMRHGHCRHESVNDVEIAWTIASRQARGLADGDLRSIRESKIYHRSSIIFWDLLRFI